jgi:hypothetical protein
LLKLRKFYFQKRKMAYPNVTSIIQSKLYVTGALQITSDMLEDHEVTACIHIGINEPTQEVKNMAEKGKFHLYNIQCADINNENFEKKLARCAYIINHYTNRKTKGCVMLYDENNGDFLACLFSAAYLIAVWTYNTARRVDNTTGQTMAVKFITKIKPNLNISDSVWAKLIPFEDTLKRYKLFED